MILTWHSPVFKFCIFFFAPISIFGFHNNNLINRNFELIGQRSGLSSNLICKILQDNEGFIWIGTGNTLTRYDGYEFREFNFNYFLLEQSTSMYIPKIIKDSKGLFWVTFSKFGLALFNPATLSEIQLPFAHITFQTKVNCVYESISGDYWIGTTDGLLKFSMLTNEYWHFRSNPKDKFTLAGNQVNCISEDKNHIIWIGTDRGVSLYFPDKNQFRSEYYTPGEEHCLSNNYVTGFLSETKEGVMWITTQWGLNRVKTDEIVRPDSHVGFKRYFLNSGFEFSPNIQMLIKDDLENYWLATNKGVVKLRFDAGGEIVGMKLFLTEKEFKNSIGLNKIFKIFTDSKNHIWAISGTINSGIFEYIPMEGRFIQHLKEFNGSAEINNLNFGDVFEDHSGNLWVGSDKGEILKLDLYQKPFEILHAQERVPNTLLSNDIYSIFEDNDNTLWIGSIKGLSKFNPHTGVFAHYVIGYGTESTIAGSIVGTIVPGNYNDLWIGYYDNKISRLDLETNKFVHYNNIPNSKLYFEGWSPRGILVDENGTLWIATLTSGVAKMARHANSFTFYKPTSDHYSISSEKAYCLFKEDSNTLWVGTMGGGLNKMNIDFGSFTSYKHNRMDTNSISSNEVRIIHRDRFGNFWIGTSFGLNRFCKKSGRFSKITTEDGLAGNIIKGILEDSQGYLWISTNNGLSRYSPGNQNIRNFTTDNGLPGNYFNDYAFYGNSDGKFYFGTSEGLLGFYPEQIKDNTFNPIPKITKLFVNHTIINPGDSINGRVLISNQISQTSELVLKHFENNLIFEFASLHYSVPSQNKIFYKLEGHSEQWKTILSPDRTLTLINLNRGKYKLRLKTSNPDGYWSKEEVCLAIVILSPWWKAWWFKILLILVIGAITFILYRIRSIRLGGTNKSHEGTGKERKKSLFYPDINTNIVTYLGDARQNLISRYMGSVNQATDEKSATSPDDKFLEKAIDIINKQMANPAFGFEELAKEIAMSKSQLYRKIKAVTGVSVNLFIRDVRLEKAAQLLSAESLQIAQVAVMVGFTNHSFFTKCFTAKYKISPKEYAERFSK